MALNTRVFGGGLTKAVSVDTFFEYLEALGGTTDANALYQSVAWMFRATQLRADAVSSIPYLVLDEHDKEVEWPIRLGDDLWQTEAFLCQYGAAYWLKKRNLVALRDLRVLNSSGMTVKTDPQKGIVAFVYRAGKVETPYKPKDIVYFRYWNPADDLGPGIAPANVSQVPGVLTKNANEWASRFFEQGAIPAVILSTEQMLPEGEAERIRTAWERFTKGVKNAWRTIVLRAGLKPTIVGMPIGDLAMPDLMLWVQKQISAAYGVPLAMLEESAANRATAAVHRLSFWTETIFPEAQRMQQVLNEQLFDAFGWHMEFQFHEVEAVQQDEAQKAAGLSSIIGTINDSVERDIVDPDEARAVISNILEQMNLPPLKKNRPKPPEPEPEEEAPPEEEELPEEAGVEEAPPELETETAVRSLLARALRDDLHKWRGKVVGRKTMTDFASGVIPPTLHDLLMLVQGDNAIKAFSFLKQWEEARDASEAELERVVNEILEKYHSQFARALHAGKEPDYDAMARDLSVALRLEMADIATEAILRATAETGIEFDPAFINAEALDWARTYSYELVTGIMDTTRKQIAAAVSTFIETPGQTIGDLTAALRPTVAQLEKVTATSFGPRRAKLIAVTETTRAYSAATAETQRDLNRVGVQMERIWHTANDEKVCPVCGPFNNKSEVEWSREFPDGPPAHPGCRCGVGLEVIRRGD